MQGLGRLVGMKKQFLVTFARFLAGIVLLAALAGTNRLSAQATGTIVGTVTDMSGAAVQALRYR